MKTNFFAFVSCLGLVACQSLPPPEQGPLDLSPALTLTDVRRLADKANLISTHNEFVEVTSIPGIYAIRTPSFNGCGIYVNSSVTIVANNGVRGWTYVKGDRPISIAHQQALGKHIYQNLPENLLKIPGKYKAAKGAVLISGVDCEPSVAIEKNLNKYGLSYRILPSALNISNLPYARALACSADPVAAWLGDREGVDRRGLPNGRCTVSMKNNRDISCMFSGGRTPTLLLPDGSASENSTQIPDLLNR